MLDGKRYYAAFPDEDRNCDHGSRPFSKRWGNIEKSSENTRNYFGPKSSKAPRRSRLRSLRNESKTNWYHFKPFAEPLYWIPSLARR